jgi:hypothetical protein
VTPVELLRDLLARIVWVREETDPYVRDEALASLEADVAGAIGRLEGRTPT